jgi:hypothetical protein
MFERDQAESGPRGQERLTRLPRALLLAALLSGAILGAFQIANTSIGWHLASGRFIIEHRSFLHADPFTFTAAGTPWIDHEWLFQVIAATADALGGAPLLVFLRMAIVATLAGLLLLIGVRSGLSPTAALVLSVLCVAGARPRFFLRPELATLVVVPAVTWLYISRMRRRSWWWLGAIAGLVALGVNAHGGALVLPFLLGGLLAARTLQMVFTANRSWGEFASGAAAVAVSALAVLANPYGWRLYAVPFRLAKLVGQPHIPNPEWVAPSLTAWPSLYVAIVVAVLVLILKERRAEPWALLLMASALALRHVRNLGLFFVLLPLAAAPALARWPALAEKAERLDSAVRRQRALGVALALILALALAAGPRPPFGFSFAEDYYPEAACSFLDREGLPDGKLYNDVRFGGYLINRYYPPRTVFLDDRNEIHEPLLREFWEIFRRSDVTAWNTLLAGYGIDTALVRYHPTTRVLTPDGRDLGERGFSALWFPAGDWALVYWDDVAMVLVRRDAAPPGLLERSEYHVLRPDDFINLESRLAVDEDLRPTAAAELRRALREAPHSQRAQRLSAFLADLDSGGGVTGP